MSLRVATYNIHKGVSAFGRQVRIHGIKDAIAALDADLLFLQEVQGQHDVHAAIHAHWPRLGQHEFLAGTSHHSAYGMNAVYEAGHHGNALLSRYPILETRNHDVSDHAFEQRGILHARVAHPEGEIHCFVIHLGLLAASRRRQIDALIDTVHTHAGRAPLIIAGDFNDWGRRLSHTLYRELGVFEAFDVDAQHSARTSSSRLWPFAAARRSHARTFPARLPWLCLDRVYLRGFRLESAQVLHGTPWQELSDHVPLVAALDWQRECS